MKHNGKNVLCTGMAIMLCMPLLAHSASTKIVDDTTCIAPALSDQQVKNIIARERAAQPDLPAQFSKYKSMVRKKGCHYTYIEYLLPETPDASQIFTLNQYGVIVSVQVGITPPDAIKIKCPKKVLTKSQLTKIIKKERQKRNDLPAAFSSYTIRVMRSQCTYLYFEYAVPEQRGNFQVFTIDPFGELMDFSRSKPY